MDYSEKGKRKKAVAFDFLGVVTKHDGNPFISEETYAEAEPNASVIKAMGSLQERGYKIIIHSTIANSIIETYCAKHNVPFDEINGNSDYQSGNSGKPVAEVYVDDRALQYSGQSPEELLEQVINFRPYWKQ
jgi:hypothetical protein